MNYTCGGDYIKKCENCGVTTNNPRFCSRSCSAKITNKESVKRAKTKICKNLECDTKIASDRTYCIKHKNKDWSKETIETTSTGRSYNHRYAAIRHNSRSVYKLFNKELKCIKCNYDKHIEVCHIKPISDFNKDTSIDEVNSINNLIGLCPNCHWELDYGDLNIEDIIKPKL